jgi:hypothetical protein
MARKLTYAIVAPDVVWSFYVIDLDAVRDEPDVALDSYPRRAWRTREAAMAAAEYEVKKGLRMKGVIRSANEVVFFEWMGDRTGGRYCYFGETVVFVYKIRVE